MVLSHLKGEEAKTRLPETLTNTDFKVLYRTIFFFTFLNTNSELTQIAFSGLLKKIINYFAKTFFCVFEGSLLNTLKLSLAK